MAGSNVVIACFRGLRFQLQPGRVGNDDAAGVVARGRREKVPEILLPSLSWRGRGHRVRFWEKKGWKGSVQSRHRLMYAFRQFKLCVIVKKA